MTMREQKCSQICEQMFNFSESIFFRDFFFKCKNPFDTYRCVNVRYTLRSD